MKPILVTYASMAGSTAEVAQAVADELGKGGFQVEIMPLEQVKELGKYGGVILGAPMIMGWHRAALRFLKRNRRTLQSIPLAVFVLALSVTKIDPTGLENLPLTVDEDLPKPPQDPARLSFRERYARLSHYLQPILKTVHPTVPVSIGVFGGRLEYGRLKWWAVLFVMLIIQAPAGDRRNWDTIHEWAASLSMPFGGPGSDKPS